MSRVTQLRLLRKANPGLDKDAEFRIAVASKEFPCPICNLPMILSIGQIKACHPACKPEFKKWSRYQQKHKDKLRLHD